MKPGLHPDGDGLYLRVTKDGAKMWVFRYMLNGKPRKMGLGSFKILTLAKAREKVIDCRRQLRDGIDPIKARNDVKIELKLAAARSQTFKQCALAYIESHSAAWRNEKHADQWKTSLETYAYPTIGPLPVQDIDVSLVLKILEQELEKFEGKKFWLARPETANRVRNRIEAVLDWAKAREYRVGENPARWRGHLENLLPPRSKIRTVKHHAALPYREVGDFIITLKEQRGIGVSAFEFLILTAARSGEVLGARWKEIDLAKKVWTIPADRIKSGRQHRVPLANRAIEILTDAPGEKKPDDFVFTGKSGGDPISKMGLLILLDTMKRRDITVHGFRSTFRDWAAEMTNFPYEVAKASIAHTLGDKVEEAYLRSDFFLRRVQLMSAWARYCATPSSKEGGEVVSMMDHKLATG
jgi:integrase